MSILDRFILGIYTFCLAVISLFIVLMVASVVPYTFLINSLITIANNPEYLVITGVIAGIFFLVSLKFLLSGRFKASRDNVIKKTSELGSILISLKSIESIIISAIKQMDGVMDVKIELENRKDEVGVGLKVIVTPERSVPELSAIIQARTKEAIESIAGIGVSTIEVLVEDVIQTIRPIIKNRVE